MAKLQGYLPVLGTLGGLTFARGENGEVIVKQKTTLNGDRIRTDPAYRRTRETMAEFGNAGKTGKFFLHTFRELVLHKPDRRIFSRLQKLMMTIVGTDQSHPLGERLVADGDLQLLLHFEFNKKAELPGSFWGSYTSTIDRVTGLVKTIVDPYIPEEMVQMPEGAKFYRFVTGGIGLDIPGETFERDRIYSAWLTWNNTVTTPLTLSAQLDPASTLPLFQVLGIEYAKDVSGVKYPLSNGAFNAMRIVSIDA